MENPLQFAEEKEEEWTTDIELILSNILFNCNAMSQHHKLEHVRYSNRLKYYKLPIIIFSGINSILSIGGSSFFSQEATSFLNCFISLIISIIGSIELFLQINKRADQELQSYYAFYNLSIKISTVLTLDKNHRTEHEPKLFLTSVINEYTTVFNEALLNGLEENDKVIKIDIAR
jgi:amino acid permease